MDRHHLLLSGQQSGLLRAWTDGAVGWLSPFFWSGPCWFSADCFPNVTLSGAKGLPGCCLADSSSACGAPQNDRVGAVSLATSQRR